MTKTTTPRRVPSTRTLRVNRCGYVVVKNSERYPIEKLQAIEGRTLVSYYLHRYNSQVKPICRGGKGKPYLYQSWQNKSFIDGKDLYLFTGKAHKTPIKVHYNFGY